MQVWTRLVRSTVELRRNTSKRGFDPCRSGEKVVTLHGLFTTLSPLHLARTVAPVNGR